MATTKTKKNTKEKAVATKGTSHPLIIGARMTEKAALGAEKGIYTFNVENNANKTEIKKAIKMLYGVTPVKVAVTQITDKIVMRRTGTFGTKRGGKKAVVHLKKGDKITLA
jgi:large subunit ribosomal protein L23